MTKKEMFNLIATVNADNAEIVAFCEKEIELLSRKRSSVNSKAKKEAGEDVKAFIAEKGL